MWKVKIHHLVIDEDFKKISKKDRSIIIKTIYKKLGSSPEEYGSPLRHVLKGYWKLKISDYRVIYRIEKKEVKVACPANKINNLIELVEYRISNGCQDVTSSLGIQHMPNYYALMLDADGAMFFWVRWDGVESITFADRWDAYRSAKADSVMV